MELRWATPVVGRVWAGLGSPAGVRGRDGSGAVEVVLAGDSLPALIHPLSGWERAVGLDRVGVAVREAFALAHRAFVAATAGEVAAAVTALPSSGAAVPASVLAAGGVFGLSPLQVLDRAERLPAGPGSGGEAVGQAVGGAVTVGLARPAGLWCRIDRRWAQSVGPAVAEGGLAQALAAARRELPAPSEMSPGAGWAGLVGAMLDRIEALHPAGIDEQRAGPAAGLLRVRGGGDGADRA